MMKDAYILSSHCIQLPIRFIITRGMQPSQMRFLDNCLNSIPYDQKNLVREHIRSLFLADSNFHIRSAASNNIKSQVEFFIEVIGYVIVGKHMHELRISFPHQYSVVGPIFHLVYYPDVYRIENEGILVGNKSIQIYKNQANQTIIEFGFASLKSTWSNNRKNMVEGYREVVRFINNPPLLTSFDDQKLRESSQNLIRSSSSGMTEQVITEIEVSVMTLMDNSSKIQKLKRENDHSEAKIDFLRRNVPKLIAKMSQYEDGVVQKLRNFERIQEELLLSNNCDALFEIQGQDREKISAIAKHQALRETQKTLVSMLQRSLREKAISFADYKNLIRQLYEKMFDSKTELLKLGL